MPLGLILPSVSTKSSTAIAEQAEHLGYDTLWVSELWGTDAFVQLADIATQTETIGLGTAIVNVFSRSPAVIAMAAATVDRIAPGRFTLGVGPSTLKAVEDLHGMAYDRPVRRTHETVELIKAYLSDSDRVTYNGDLISVADFPGLDVDVPVYNAALGPANRRATGRLCDGWIPHNIPFNRLPDAFEVIADTAQERGRDPDSITVAPYVPAAVSENKGTAYDAVRGHLAYYIGSGEGYRRAVATVFPDEADEIAVAWQNGNRTKASSAVTEEMVHSLAVAGTPNTAIERLRNIINKGIIDRPMLTVPRQADDELTLRTIDALAPNNW
ncbi:LLM class flavin-dependent oxidoreductase [Haladaptatus pallidirubidus]|uniref:LLM class F420-dependent oxidoreductase n=1 Tax=Haladaptatus pallidirubidus TaxID=1008152 RepID=A0AAV3UR69_9EURY|nr:LLM class flavin-dependent oxidoreductase [Haladaptatus pallidirubidus]